VNKILHPLALLAFGHFALVRTLPAIEPLHYTVSWLGNSFSGASNKWVQNFFVHTKVQPDGTVNTWSHWDEGGKKFGVYKDGDVIGNQDVKANSLEVMDKAGRQWKIEFDYVEPKFHEYDFNPKSITCDGVPVKFPGLFEPMALALANDGQLMIADSQTSPRQQVLFYDVSKVVAGKSSDATKPDDAASPSPLNGLRTQSRRETKSSQAGVRGGKDRARTAESGALDNLTPHPQSLSPLPGEGGPSAVVTGIPVLTRAFGDYGGIASGKPGEVTPTKFWGIRGLGMDAEGNIYVAMSEMGSCLRKFFPEGKLLWELHGDFFVDVACADPRTDALDV
jgi:hypothetical protein